MVPFLGHLEKCLIFFCRKPYYECQLLILHSKARTTTRFQFNNHSAGLKYHFCNIHFSPFTDFKQMFCTSKWMIKSWIRFSWYAWTELISKRFDPTLLTINTKIQKPGCIMDACRFWLVKEKEHLLHWSKWEDLLSATKQKLCDKPILPLPPPTHTVHIVSERQ